MVKIYNNIIFIIKLLIAEKIFKKILSYSLKNNNKSINIDLFWKKTAVLVKNIFLQNYIYQTQKK